MIADVGDAQRRWVLDQRPQHAAPPRQAADRGMRRLVDPPRQEADQFCARLVEHAERRVARLGQLLRRLQHAIEHHVEIELGEHAAGHIENSLCCAIHCLPAPSYSARAGSC